MSDDEDTEHIRQTGVFDAHCHPTDIMDSIARIADMEARALTVMSTRAQDQELVANAAEQYLISSKADIDVVSSPRKRYVVPAFGWHPWFSHQMVDDRPPSSTSPQTGDRNGSIHANVDAIEHYKTVLTPPPPPPPPPTDSAFLTSLQPPLSLATFLHQTEQRLQRFPLALVGEIGLDRNFRLPTGPSSITGDVSQKTGGDASDGTYTPGSREGRALTPHRVSMEHQKVVLRAQLELAAKYGRAVSVHSVQAHGVVFEVLQGLWKGHERPSRRELKRMKERKNQTRHTDGNGNEKVRDDGVPPTATATVTATATLKATKPYPPRICMHSYSGPKDTLIRLIDPKIPADVFFSFSECINFSNTTTTNNNDEPPSAKTVDVIKAVPQDRILIESDLHCAGERMDGLLRDILRRVCEYKGWTVEEGVKILRRNWERFVFGEDAR